MEGLESTSDAMYQDLFDFLQNTNDISIIIEKVRGGSSFRSYLCLATGDIIGSSTSVNSLEEIFANLQNSLSHSQCPTPLAKPQSIHTSLRTHSLYQVSWRNKFHNLNKLLHELSERMHIQIIVSPVLHMSVQQVQRSHSNETLWSREGACARQFVNWEHLLQELDKLIER